jgi:hypothetical protein
VSCYRRDVVMRTQKLVRLGISLLPLYVYGLCPVVLVYGGALRYVPGFFAVIFSLFYSFGWMDDLHAGKDLIEIGNDRSRSAFTRVLTFVGGLVLVVALMPLAPLRCTYRRVCATTSAAAA